MWHLGKQSERFDLAELAGVDDADGFPVGDDGADPDLDLAVDAEEVGVGCPLLQSSFVFFSGVFNIGSATVAAFLDTEFVPPPS